MFVYAVWLGAYWCYFVHLRNAHGVDAYVVSVPIEEDKLSAVWNVLMETTTNPRAIEIVGDETNWLMARFVSIPSHNSPPFDELTYQRCSVAWMIARIGMSQQM